MSRRRRVQAQVESESEEETDVDIPGNEAAGGDEEEEDVDDTDPVIIGVRTSMENLKQLVKDLLPTCETVEQREQVIQRLKACMMSLIKTEMNHIEGVKTVSRVSVDLPDADSADDQAILRACDQLEKVSLKKINEYKASLTDAVLMRHRNYKGLLLEIQSTLEACDADQDESVMDIDAPDDENQGNTTVADLENDDGVSPEYIPTTDPITKMPLTDPVRNMICKHIYGKAAMLGLIKSNPHVRCPTAGCSNRNFVKPKDLMTDRALTAKVQKKIKESQSQQGAAGGT